MENPHVCIRCVLRREIGFPLTIKWKFPRIELVEVKIRNVYDKYSIFSSKVIVLVIRIGGISEEILRSKGG